MGRKAQARRMNETALEEAHLILSDAFRELEPVPEAVQGVAQALDLVAHHETRHRHECQACQRGEACPSLLTIREISGRLTLALEIISRYADLQLEYVRDGVDVLGQELWGADEREARKLSKGKEMPSLEVIEGGEKGEGEK